MNDTPDTDNIDQQLAELAEQERHYQAPGALRAAIAQRVHNAMDQRLTDRRSLPERTLQWLTARWWRMLPLGASAAAVPLLTGALLGYQLESADYPYEDPAADWITSYSTAAVEASVNPTLEESL